MHKKVKKQRMNFIIAKKHIFCYYICCGIYLNAIMSTEGLSFLHWATFLFS